MLKDLLAESAKQLENMNKECDATYGTGQFPPEVKAHHLAQISSAFALGEQSGIAKGKLEEREAMKSELIVKFNERFRYFVGKPTNGSLELTHNNVRDFLATLNNQK